MCFVPRGIATNSAAASVLSRTFEDDRIATKPLGVFEIVGVHRVLCELAHDVGRAHRGDHRLQRDDWDAKR